MYDQLIRLGPPPFDEADRAEAAKFQSTLTDEDVASAFRRVGVPMRQGVPLCDQIVPLDAKSAPMVGSTDVGDVSWVVPTVQARGATYAVGTPGNSWRLPAQGKMGAGTKGRGDWGRGVGLGSGGRRLAFSSADAPVPVNGATTDENQMPTLVLAALRLPCDLT